MNQRACSGRSGSDPIVERPWHTKGALGGPDPGPCARSGGGRPGQSPPTLRVHAGDHRARANRARAGGPVGPRPAGTLGETRVRAGPASGAGYSGCRQAGPAYRGSFGLTEWEPSKARGAPVRVFFRRFDLSHRCIKRLHSAAAATGLPPARGGPPKNPAARRKIRRPGRADRRVFLCPRAAAAVVWGRPAVTRPGTVCEANSGTPAAPVPHVTDL